METSSKKVELEATDVRFLSPGDERAFFGWLDKLSCVDLYEGRGRTLTILVNSAAVDEDNLRELLALFRRYGIGLRQLVSFDRHEFGDWFHNGKAYWYQEIFGA
jgi:hypothetical protein